MSSGNAHTVVFRGRPVKADVEVVRQLMVENCVPPREQVGLWLELWNQIPDSECGMLFLAEAERIGDLVKRADALAQSVHGGEAWKGREKGDREKGFSPLAVRHFVWLGDRKGIHTESLRGGIAGLSRIGMIRNDREQQEALRRGLGLTLNDDERSSDAPWVEWLGPADMLAYLIDSLWDMGLITCAGGQQEKWNTATGMFRKPDYKLFKRNTLRNSRCSDKEKLILMDRAILEGLRYMM